MALNPINIAELNTNNPVVDEKGRPNGFFLRFLNGAIRALQNGLNGIIDAQIAAAAATAAAAGAVAAAATANAAAAVAQTAAVDAGSGSSLATSGVGGLTMTATDAGTDVTITISAHTRVYGDGTSVAVSAGSLTARAYSTVYYIYYDDPTRAGGAVTYQSTTSAATAAQTGTRHSLGTVTTPAALGAPVPGRYNLPPGVVPSF